MKFITEMEVRDLYKIEPFTTYVLESDTKITPEARQFLVDRGVSLVQAQCSDAQQSNTRVPKRTQTRENWCVLRLRRRMEYIESLFLLVGAELFGSGNPVMAEQIMVLGKCFRDLQNAEQEQISLDEIQSGVWSEEVENCSSNLGNELAINELHVRLENGKEIAVLNHLRISLREVETAILETYWDEEKQSCSRQDLIDRVNLIISILCIMMRNCLGGQKWKR